jgi:hypothetical protein
VEEFVEIGGLCAVLGDAEAFVEEFRTAKLGIGVSSKSG